jgi:hypothetical protein
MCLPLTRRGVRSAWRMGIRGLRCIKAGLLLTAPVGCTGAALLRWARPKVHAPSRPVEDAQSVERSHARKSLRAPPKIPCRSSCREQGSLGDHRSLSMGHGLADKCLHWVISGHC